MYAHVRKHRNPILNYCAYSYIDRIRIQRMVSDFLFIEISLKGLLEIALSSWCKTTFYGRYKVYFYQHLPIGICFIK